MLKFIKAKCKKLKQKFNEVCDTPEKYVVFIAFCVTVSLVCVSTLAFLLAISNLD